VQAPRTRSEPHAATPRKGNADDVLEALVIPMPADSGARGVFGDERFGDAPGGYIKPLRYLALKGLKERRQGWPFDQCFFAEVIPPPKADETALCHVLTKT